MAFGTIIQILINTSVKSSVNFEISINPLIERFKNSCPLEDELKRIIKQKNSLSQALTQTQSVLTSINNTSNSIENILKIIEGGVNTIKLLPIPSAVPPGVGLPMNIINGFSDLLDILGYFLREGKGTVSQISPALNIVIDNINLLISKLNELDKLIVGCFEQQTEELTDEEKKDFFEKLGIDLDSELKLYQKYNEQDNLSFNSKDPYYYKGFKLILEHNKQNIFSFPLRRITANNKFLNKKIVGPWSYSSSVQVLIDTVKFEIDKFLFYNVDVVEQGIINSTEFTNPNPQLNPPNINTPSTPKAEKSIDDKLKNIKTNFKQQYAPFLGPGIDKEVKIYRRGNITEFYQFSAKDKKWITPYVPNLSPINTPGKYDKEIKTINDLPNLKVYFYEWQKIYYKWVFLREENI